jgi:ferritin-like metal-binding protein YciE
MVGHLREGLQERWQRLRAGFGGKAPAIDSMMVMYRAELHELRSAEEQLCTLADELWISVRSAPLGDRLSDYVSSLRARRVKLESVLAEIGAESSERADEVMRALVDKASKMAEQCSENVRDAALVASIQRIIHYMIAEHGTIAAHAKALGRLHEAAHFAEQAELDRNVDRELSDLAKSVLNPEAVLAPGAADKGRGH